MATRLDEGLEDFFSRRVMDESSRCGIQAHTPSFSRPRGPRKAPVSTHLPGRFLQWQSPWDISPHILFLPHPALSSPAL